MIVTHSRVKEKTAFFATHRAVEAAICYASMPTAEAAAKVEREKRGRRNYLPLDGYFGEWQHKYYSEPKPSIENHLFFSSKEKETKYPTS